MPQGMARLVEHGQISMRVYLQGQQTWGQGSCRMGMPVHDEQAVHDHINYR